MPIIRFKNKVPEVYISESRDFQIFIRILDIIQNSIKLDIDNMSNILSTEDISDVYIENLKSKIGFYTNKTFADNSIRLALAAFPYIIKYKGSYKGIVRCVNTFSKIMGITTEPKINIYNYYEENPEYNYTIRIGIKHKKLDTQLLDELLKYVVPTGYIVEIYFYEDTSIPNIDMAFTDIPYQYKTTGLELMSVRENKSNTNNIDSKYFNTVQSSVIYEIKEEGEQINAE